MSVPGTAREDPMGHSGMSMHSRMRKAAMHEVSQPRRVRRASSREEEGEGGVPEYKPGSEECPTGKKEQPCTGCQSPCGVRRAPMLVDGLVQSVGAQEG